jgi:hypothetical protein
LRSTTPYDDDGLVEFFFFSPPLHVWLYSTLLYAE